MTSIYLVALLTQIGCIKTGEFTLKSGVSSSIYIDLRIIISYPRVLQNIAESLWKSMQHLDPMLICGVPYTALPIATAISIQHNIPMILRRKEQKTYGMKNKIDGIFTSGQECIVVEDVVSSGASILETVTDLHASNIKVEQVF